jgi:hypothetical protein
MVLGDVVLEEPRELGFLARDPALHLGERRGLNGFFLKSQEALGKVLLFRNITSKISKGLALAGCNEALGGHPVARPPPAS